MTDTLRGHQIYQSNGQWFYADTHEPTASTWQDRPCGHCGLHNTPEGHDGCLGTLPFVLNACCGHGEIKDAYVQFNDGIVIRGLKSERATYHLKKLIEGDKHENQSK